MLVSSDVWTSPILPFFLSVCVYACVCECAHACLSVNRGRLFLLSGHVRICINHDIIHANNSIFFYPLVLLMLKKTTCNWSVLFFLYNPNFHLTVGDWNRSERMKSINSHYFFFFLLLLLLYKEMFSFLGRIKFRW